MNNKGSGWTWEEVKQQYPVGSIIEGTVVSVVPYGVWIDLGVGFPGLLLIPDAGLGRGQQTYGHFQPGDAITTKVILFNDERLTVRLFRQV